LCCPVLQMYPNPYYKFLPVKFVGQRRGLFWMLVGTNKLLFLAVTSH
jgi:hypothetical protein